MDDKLLRDAHEVFCKVFDSNISYENFRHKHMDDPELAGDMVTMVDYQDGVPAGTNSFMGATLICGGKKLYFVLSCDTAVKEDFRGRHIFSNLIRQALQRCEEQGVDFMMAVPNQNSYPGFVRLKFQEVGTQWTYKAVLRPVQVLRSRLLHKETYLPPFEDKAYTEPAGYEWQMTSDCPFSEDDLAAINSRTGIFLQRSREMFAWKIDCYPREAREYICVRRDGKLCAYFIVIAERSNGGCIICDWMLPGERNSARRIVRRLVRYLRKYAGVASIPSVNPERGEPGLLHCGGFLFRKRGVPLMFYPTSDAVGEKEAAYMRDFKNWMLRYIDADTILNI